MKADVAGAAVPCSTCPGEVVLTHEQLRALVDADRRPECERCRSERELQAALAARRLKITNARSSVDRALLVVADWLARNRRPIGETEAVVVVWESDRKRFGLAGYATLYPDSNKIKVALVHQVSRGMLYRPERLHYNLTPLGVEYVAKLRAEAAQPAPAPRGGVAGNDPAQATARRRPSHPAHTNRTPPPRASA